MKTMPQIVGQTEQALTRLLFTKGIAEAPIVTNDQWVAMNVLASADHESRAVDAIAEALSASLERVEFALAQLEAAGLVARAGERWALTDIGHSVLATCRERVRHITAELERGIGVGEREIVERVLDLVRARALTLAAM